MLPASCEYNVQFLYKTHSRTLAHNAVLCTKLLLGYDININVLFNNSKGNIIYI